MGTITAPEMLNTRSGLQLLVRPTTEFDETELRRFFDRVSDDDRRFRFLAARDHISHEQIEPLVHVDHFRSESYLAFETIGGKLIATAQLACDNPLDTAEVAISVRADFKGKGVGWALLDLLSREARKRGVRRVISIESRDNHEAIELEREKGFTAEPVEGDASLVLLSKIVR